MLAPIWDEAADKVQQQAAELGKVVIGKVDCDSESEWFPQISALALWQLE